MLEYICKMYTLAVFNEIVENQEKNKVDFRFFF